MDADQVAANQRRGMKCWAISRYLEGLSLALNFSSPQECPNMSKFRTIIDNWNSNSWSHPLGIPSCASELVMVALKTSNT